MKNLNKFLVLFAIMVIIGFASCETDGGGDGPGKDPGDNNGGNKIPTISDTNGSLTISGLKTHSGKWIVAFGGKMEDMFGDPDKVEDEGFFAADNISQFGTVTGARIDSDGKATLKVWKSDDNGLSNFKESGDYFFMYVVISKASIGIQDLEPYIDNDDFFGDDDDFEFPDWLEDIGFGFAEFKSGTGTGTIF